jgi:hypothetical protein
MAFTTVNDVSEFTDDTQLPSTPGLDEFVQVPWFLPMT